MNLVFNEIVRFQEFNKDLKKLLKRFPTLKEDIHTLIKVSLVAFHKLKLSNKGIFQIPGLKISYPKLYKVKKIACRSMKGKGVNTGLRLIYAYFEKEDKVELIEIYYKSDKKNENRGRISKYYKK